MERNLDVVAAQATQDSDKKILIVEDEIITVMILQKILSGAGYNVLSATTGEEAIQLLQIIPGINMVLMDIHLRGELNGIETARRLKSRVPGLILIYVTGNSDPKTKQEAEGTGPISYLLKPVNTNELLKIIESSGFSEL